MTAIDLRSIVLNNLYGSSSDEIKGYIQDTIDTREEDALPGMGILFEAVWIKSDEGERNLMMQKIMDTIENQQTKAKTF